jgi:hypothetical protein
MGRLHNLKDAPGTGIGFIVLRVRSWWMYRDADHIGRIWADGGHRAFHFQNMEPVDVGQTGTAASWSNHQNDGLWVVQEAIDVIAL